MCPPRRAARRRSPRLATGGPLPRRDLWRGHQDLVRIRFGNILETGARHPDFGSFCCCATCIGRQKIYRALRPLGEGTFLFWFFSCEAKIDGYYSKIHYIWYTSHSYSMLFVCMCVLCTVYNVYLTFIDNYNNWLQTNSVQVKHTLFSWAGQTSSLTGEGQRDSTALGLGWGVATAFLKVRIVLGH